MDERTGERLDDASALHRADLARHRAAYRFAAACGPIPGVAAARAAFSGAAPRVLDLGCGTGYGAAELAAAGLQVVGLDRVRPALRARQAGARFVCGDLERLPFASARFDRIVSFQVVEHLADPGRYLGEMARLLGPGGVALVSTPNRLQSDGENPYHLREYTAEELAEILGRRFERVELQGIHAHGPAARYHAGRLRSIRRITRLDPLGLRRRLPRAVVDPAFAWLSILVRLGARRQGLLEAVGDDDFRVEAALPGCIDLLAICSGPRGGPIRS